MRSLGPPPAGIVHDGRPALHGQPLPQFAPAGIAMAPRQMGQRADLPARLGIASDQPIAIAGYLMVPVGTVWASILAYQDGFWLLVGSLLLVALPSWLLSRKPRPAEG